MKADEKAEAAKPQHPEGAVVQEAKAPLERPVAQETAPAEKVTNPEGSSCCTSG